ncbi:cysteine-rich repeat secretory protein 55-like [Coffea eugenioides]|uniref:cysteine-rich repeat secretory protein 55-like n=1 Tax=Coffea eugenioides TaxID=49369 RepID=UPI000F60AD6D|nr:cysteine-rich repeat secretory protein 55-like [Coffea eugenioides]
MASFHKLLLLLTALFICTAESAELWSQFCNDNSPINSPQLSANIDSLLAELVSGTVLNGFSTSSYGKAKDQVFGLGQCRGDVSNEDCSSCIKDASKQIRKLCPTQADARIWYDYCFLRYDTEKFFGRVDTSIGIFFYNVENVTDPDSFNKELGNLSDKISSEAVAPGNNGLGRGKKELSPFLTLYELVQCTRDLSQLSCEQCLAIAIGEFPTFCNNKKGCRVLYSSCIVRYELYPFFFPLDPKETLVNMPMKYYHSSTVIKP